MIRYSAKYPCPVCGGHDQMERGKGLRCAGFVSDDPNWCRCTRPEHAGDLVADERTTPPTYAHKLTGECRCGTEHGSITATAHRTTTTAAPSRRIVATYDYQAADGKVLYRVARMEPKGFLPQHINGTGTWEPGYASAERVLYHLPELTAAPGRVAFICEGEKDCDRLTSLGLLATTNAGGSASWRKHAEDYGELFRGRARAVVLVDNDDAGRKWATDVAATVDSVGTPVVLLELEDLPAAGDVSDWLDLGHSVDELKARVASAHRWTPPIEVVTTVTSSPVSEPLDPDDYKTEEELGTAVQTSTQDPEKVEMEAGKDGIGLVPASSVRPERVTWAADQRVPLGMVTLLVGEGGLGKSMEACRLAAGWSRGTIPGDLFGIPVTVAIASAEDHRAAVIVPRLQAAGADLDRIQFVQQRIDGIATDIDIDGEVEHLENVLQAGGVRVLIVDTVVAHIPSQHDTFKEQSVRRVLKPLAHMAERGNLGVVGVMHLNRRDARDVLTRISGSGGFGNLARQVLLFTHDPDDPDGPNRILAVGKSNVGAHAPTLRLRVTPDAVPADDGEMIPTARLVVVGETDQTASQLLGPSLDDEERGAKAEAMDFLTGLLGNGEPVEAKTVKAAATDAGITNITLRRAAKALGVKTNERAGFGPGFPSRWRLLAQPDPYMLLAETRATRGADEQVGNHATPSDVVTSALPDAMRHSACPRCGAVATVLSSAADSLCARCAPPTAPPRQTYARPTP